VLSSRHELQGELSEQSEPVDIKDVLVQVSQKKSRQSLFKDPPRLLVDDACNGDLGEPLHLSWQEGEIVPHSGSAALIDDLMVGIKNGTGVMRLSGRKIGPDYQTQPSMKVSENQYSTYSTPKFNQRNEFFPQMSVKRNPNFGAISIQSNLKNEWRQVAGATLGLINIEEFKEGDESPPVVDKMFQSAKN